LQLGFEFFDFFLGLTILGLFECRGRLDEALKFSHLLRVKFAKAFDIGSLGQDFAILKLLDKALTADGLDLCKAAVKNIISCLGRGAAPGKYQRETLLPPGSWEQAQPVHP
jgi:hypothetical protein